MLKRVESCRNVNDGCGTEIGSTEHLLAPERRSRAASIVVGLRGGGGGILSESSSDDDDDDDVWVW